MQVAPNEKFGAVFLSRCHVGADIPQENQIGPRIWVSRRLGVEVADHWETWIGSIQAEKMAEEGLAIYVTMPSAHPELVDGDNDALHRRSVALLNGLILQGVPWHDGGYFVHGAHRDGELQIRGWNPVERYSRTHDLEFVVGLAEIRRAIALADCVRTLEAAGDSIRLQRGLHALLRANKESNAVGDRLHQLVRALESVIKPRIGSGKRDFASRGQTFAVTGTPTAEALRELYDLRSHVEHLNVPTDALPPGGTDDERRETVNRRTRQIDVLVRTVLLRVLETPGLLAEFRTDATIDAFWQRPDAQRIGLWGNQIDIVGIQ